jgi:succinoglycan biosynthesis protein ExoA
MPSIKSDLAASVVLSVIVPVRNEAAHIERTLGQLLAQDYDAERFEVLVIDGESTDGTREIVTRLAASHANLRLLDNPKIRSSAGRNIGIRESRGDFVLVVDGHCELDGDHLSRLAAAFRETGADCIGRPQPLNVAGATTIQRTIAAARSSWLGHHPSSHVYSTQSRFVPAHSVAVAYRRSVFERVGVFDERFDACEDVELNHRIDRAGLRCHLSPELAVRYAPRSKLRGLFIQLSRYGRGRVRLWRKHPETFSLKSFLPAALVLGIAFGWTIGFVHAIFWTLYASCLLLYAGVLLATSVAVGLSQRSWGTVWFLPIVFLTIHAACGWGVIDEFVRPRERFPKELCNDGQ